MAKGIQRFIELVLDRNSAKRMERDAQSALDKGTDPSKADANLSKIDRGFDRLRGAAIKLGAALAAAFALDKIRQFGQDAVRTFMEAEGVWSRLEGSLANVGIELGKVRGEIDAAAAAMQAVTTVGDEEFASVLTELTQISGDYAASLDNVQVVADLAAAKQIDLQTAAQLVGRAMIGETGTLKRYGIVVQEGADAVAVMRAQFAGMAEREGATLAGQLGRLSDRWDDFKEAIGQALVEAGGGTSILETLNATILTATNWIAANREQLSAWVSGGITVAVGALKLLWVGVNGIANILSGALMLGIGAALGGLAQLVKLLALSTKGVAALWRVLGRKERAAEVGGQADQLFARAADMEAQAGAWLKGAGQAFSDAVNPFDQFDAGTFTPTPKPTAPGTPAAPSTAAAPAAAAAAKAKEATRERTKTDREAASAAAAVRDTFRDLDQGLREQMRNAPAQAAAGANFMAPLQYQTYLPGFGPGDAMAARAATQRPEVHIYIDPIDPNRPAWQDIHRQTARYVAERFGNPEVRVHRRTTGKG